jgi:hypothetical protein
LSFVYCTPIIFDAVVVVPTFASGGCSPLIISLSPNGFPGQWESPPATGCYFDAVYYGDEFGGTGNFVLNLGEEAIEFDVPLTNNNCYNNILGANNTFEWPGAYVIIPNYCCTSTPILPRPPQNIYGNAILQAQSRIIGDADIRRSGVWTRYAYADLQASSILALNPGTLLQTNSILYGSPSYTLAAVAQLEGYSTLTAIGTGGYVPATAELRCDAEIMPTGVGGVIPFVGSSIGISYNSFDCNYDQPINYDDPSFYDCGGAVPVSGSSIGINYTVSAKLVYSIKGKTNGINTVSASADVTGVTGGTTGINVYSAHAAVSTTVAATGETTGINTTRTNTKTSHKMTVTNTGVNTYDSLMSYNIKGRTAGIATIHTAANIKFGLVVDVTGLNTENVTASTHYSVKAKRTGLNYLTKKKRPNLLAIMGVG